VACDVEYGVSLWHNRAPRTDCHGSSNHLKSLGKKVNPKVVKTMGRKVGKEMSKKIGAKAGQAHVEQQARNQIAALPRRTN